MSRSRFQSAIVIAALFMGSFLLFCCSKTARLSPGKNPVTFDVDNVNSKHFEIKLGYGPNDYDSVKWTRSNYLSGSRPICLYDLTPADSPFADQSVIWEMFGVVPSKQTTSTIKPGLGGQTFYFYYPESRCGSPPIANPAPDTTPHIIIVRPPGDGQSAQ
jgi:hypothetical protein